MKPPITTLVAAVVLCTASASFADVVAFWSFNSLGDASAKSVEADQAATATKPAITFFGGSHVPEGQAGEACTTTDGGKYAKGKAAAWGGGVNDEGPNGMSVALDTTGFDALSLKFHCRSTKVGAPSLTVDYRVGGGEFTPIAKDLKLAGDTSFHAMTVDLAKAAGLAGAKEVELRFTFADGTSNGTTRIDNVEVLGTKK
jgi:hypothetical protein